MSAGEHGWQFQAVGVGYILIAYNAKMCLEMSGDASSMVDFEMLPSWSDVYFPTYQIGLGFMIIFIIP